MWRNTPLKKYYNSGKVLTMSDSSGFIYDKEGIDKEKPAHIMELKNVKRARIHKYVDKYPHAEFHKGKTPWEFLVMLPCLVLRKMNYMKRMQSNC